MNIFLEIYIRSKKGKKYLIENLKRFSEESPKWTFNKEGSEDYSNNIGSQGCVIVFNKDGRLFAFSFCEKGDRAFYLANIVSEASQEIPRNEYNCLAQLFYERINKWNQLNKKELKLIFSKTELELENIITAKLPRKLFQRFLNAYPLSYHPLDISRLDKFICATSRYSRKRINWEYLGEYLREKKNWPESNISWCLNRIETGLQIIREYKRLH